MNFTKPFHGVPNGAIYPVTYAVGDECPAELEAAAIELGALESPPAPAGKKGQPKAKD